MSCKRLRQRLLNATRSAKSVPGNGKPFAVRDGLFEVLNVKELSDRAVLFSLFTDAARMGVPLSRRTERSIAYVMKHPELPVRNAEVTWPVLRELLSSDYPGVALRPLQRLARLTEILPEFSRIDSLVVRDFYHRYTVDEHSLRTIEHLQELADSADPRGTRFKELWKTAERRDLLILSLLLHDVGKGMPVDNHVSGSLEALESAADRLNLSAEEKAEVHFLIERHLEMSATVQRRDIFDPATVSAFAATVGNQERLQRLCLLTYADIHAVNPEALTPWKAEMLWQLYVATSNHFSRTLDTDRLHAHDELSLLAQVRALTTGASTSEIERFLEGFPRRYLAVHSAAEIAEHRTLELNPSEKERFVQSLKDVVIGKAPLEPLLSGRESASRARPPKVSVETRTGFDDSSSDHSTLLEIVAQDRPGLLYDIGSTLARLGCNIEVALIDTEGQKAIDVFYLTEHAKKLGTEKQDLLRASLQGALG